MVKRLLVVFVGLALLCAALVACGGGAGNTGTVTVHTNATNFEQSSVTLKTGQSLQRLKCRMSSSVPTGT